MSSPASSPLTVQTAPTHFPASSLAAGALQSSIPFASAHSVITRPRTAEEEAWLQVAREVSAEFALTVDQRYKERGSPRPQLDRLL